MCADLLFDEGMVFQTSEDIFFYGVLFQLDSLLKYIV